MMDARRQNGRENEPVLPGLSERQAELYRALHAPHVHRVEVHFDDTDATGFAFHVNLLRFFDRARTSLLGARTLLRLRETSGLQFVIHKIDVDFVSPAAFGDVLTTTTHLRLTSLHKLDFEQELQQVATRQVVARAQTRVVCVGPNGRALPIPVRQILEILETSPDRERERADASADPQR
jgi:acyl-CoA thioester hydrolase